MASAGWVHCPTALQVSVVQGFPSSVQAAPLRTGWVQVPALLHTSLVQPLPSSGQAALGVAVCAQAPVSSHASVVQGLLSVVHASPVRGGWVHRPCAEQMSLVHALLSLVQGSPGVAVFTQPPLVPQVSTVQGLLSLHCAGTHSGGAEELWSALVLVLLLLVVLLLLLAVVLPLVPLLDTPAVEDAKDVDPAALLEARETALEVVEPPLLPLVLDEDERVALEDVPASPASCWVDVQKPSWQVCPSAHCCVVLQVATHAPFLEPNPSGQSAVLLHADHSGTSTINNPCPTRRLNTTPEASRGATGMSRPQVHGGAAAGLG